MNIYKLLLMALCLNIMACGSNNKTQRFKIYDDYAINNTLESVKKITTFRFQGWNSLDDNHLIISSRFKKSFLITLSHYCNNLQFATQIKIKQSMSSSLTTFDSIIVPDQPLQLCRIKSIYPITVKQKNELTALRKENK